VSGKSTNGRHELAKMMKALVSGDTAVVTKLDASPVRAATCTTLSANCKSAATGSRKAALCCDQRTPW
jgi:DNA invertase Pin-like site-specific DNA recombinase